MSKTSIGFVLSSLIYLAIGVITGVVMGFSDSFRAVFLTAHAHINVVGWISFLIYGVAYHILPRFIGRPLHSERLACAQLWLGNISLIGMAIFWTMYRYSSGQPAYLHVFATFGALQALSAIFFVHNMVRTILPIPPTPAAPPKPQPRAAQS